LRFRCRPKRSSRKLGGAAVLAPEGQLDQASSGDFPAACGHFCAGLITRETWDDLEEALIGADCGMDASLALVEELRDEAQQGRIVNRSEIASGLAAAVVRQMTPEPPRIHIGDGPTVILVVGVNGSGKTTTVGKLAYRLGELGQHVVIGAADTFRAAAIDQLAIWADRSGAQLVRQGPGPIPAPWPLTPSRQGPRVGRMSC